MTFNAAINPELLLLLAKHLLHRVGNAKSYVYSVNLINVEGPHLTGPHSIVLYKEFDLSHDLVRKLLTVSTVRPYLQLQVRRGTGRTVGKEAHHYHFVTHFHVILNLEIKLGLRRKFHCLHHTNTTTPMVYPLLASSALQCSPVTMTWPVPGETAQLHPCGHQH